MANWARTTYRIEGKNEDLKKLYEIIDGFMTGKSPMMEDKASNDWEGNIILELGESIDKKYLRGFIQTYELDEGFLSIEAEEAWGVTDFRHCLESHFEGMKVYYCVEEEGDEVFATNDDEGKYFDYSFLVDLCVGYKDAWEYFSTKEQALRFVAQQLHRESMTEEDIKQWNEDHDDGDGFIYLHEFKYVA